jgi:hypothetical protein
VVVVVKLDATTTRIVEKYEHRIRRKTAERGRGRRGN